MDKQMPFCVFGFNGVEDYRPKVWLFETAKDVCVFLWGRDLVHYAIFKNKIIVTGLFSELGKLEEMLESFGEEVKGE